MPDRIVSVSEPISFRRIVMCKPSAAMILSALLALSWVGFIASAPHAAPPESGSRQKWEYKEGAANDLENRGQDGWEAYAVVQLDSSHTARYFFKRTAK